MNSVISKSMLTVGQSNALNAIMSCVVNKNHITLNGYAGTGKTTLVKIILDEIRQRGINGVILAAPTHQAKRVLSNLSGYDANTIHSLLKINPSTYEDQEFFEQTLVPDLRSCNILICDEASMYDRKLFDILMRTIPNTTTIIACGDVAQIRPVAPGDENPGISPFFTSKRFQQVSLDEVMRSNAPIIKIATEVRNGGTLRPHVVDGNGVHKTSSVTEFLDRYFSIVKTQEDLLNNRIIAYTNKNVDKINEIVRKRLYKTNDPFVVGEIIVMQEPHVTEDNGLKNIVYNNGEYVVIDAVALSKFNYVIGDERITIEGYELTVHSHDTNTPAVINVIHDELEQSKLRKFLDKTATEFKRGIKKPNWKQWWQVRNDARKVKALPACTVHKSQGSTVDNVFVFTPCMSKADDELRQQLLYVAVTRARHNVVYV